MNATLNGTSAVLLLTAWGLIKSGREDRVRLHRWTMTAAVAISAAFLVSYLTRFAIAGDTPFRGEGAIRYVYFTILVSHVVLAVVVVPLVLRTFYLGWKRRFQPHRRLARITFPAWLYVSVTGVIVYLMLYQY